MPTLRANHPPPRTPAHAPPSNGLAHLRGSVLGSSYCLGTPGGGGARAGSDPPTHPPFSPPTHFHHIPLATGYVGYTGTRIYPRGNKKKRCDLLGASNVGNVGEQFAVCTRILYPVTNSVPGRLERPRRLGRSKRRYVGTLFVTGYNMRVHVYPHNGTFRTLSEHVGNNTVYPGTKSGNTCSHVPICCRHTMVLRFHPQPEPSRGGSNRGR